MLHDRIQRGYELVQTDERLAGYEEWWDVWQELRRRLSPEMTTFARAEPLLEASSLEDWIVDFSDDLYEEAMGDAAAAPRAVELAEQLLSAFPEEREDFRCAVRGELGEMLFLVGRSTDGASLLLELIHDHPKRAMGYVHLADALEKRGDLRWALEVLQQAQRAGVDDMEDFDGELDERIADIREQLGSEMAGAK